MCRTRREVTQGRLAAKDDTAALKAVFSTAMLAYGRAFGWLNSPPRDWKRLRFEHRSSHSDVLDPPFDSPKSGARILEKRFQSMTYKLPSRTAKYELWKETVAKRKLVHEKLSAARRFCRGTSAIVWPLSRGENGSENFARSTTGGVRGTEIQSTPRSSSEPSALTRKNHLHPPPRRGCAKAGSVIN